MTTPAIKVLFADDDAVCRAIIRSTLENSGYLPLEARNGREAVEIAARESPDLILLDIGMPEVDGFSACREIKENPESAAVPIIFLTGATDHSEIESAFVIGASDYVVKPVRPSELKARVAVHLSLRRAVSELERSHTQLLQAQKLESIGQLAAGIAHELNTPIQFVSDNVKFLADSFADILDIVDAAMVFLDESGCTDESRATLRRALDVCDFGFASVEIPKALEQSGEGLRRVAAIVRAMKDFSHPGGKEMAPIDINQAITSTIAVARNEWKYHASVDCNLDPDLPHVICSLGEINQVILNLIVNAVHAIADARVSDESPLGTIRITTRHDGPDVQILVQDDGCGIPASIRDRIFDPFFTTKGVGRGTGQGLAIARSVIVELHGGTISVDSVVGRGSTFSIRLPIERNAPKLASKTGKHD